MAAVFHCQGACQSPARRGVASTHGRADGIIPPGDGLLQLELNGRKAIQVKRISDAMWSDVTSLPQGAIPETDG